MTSLAYRKRQRATAEFYDRAFLGVVAISCAVVTAAWGLLLVEVLI